MFSPIGRSIFNPSGSAARQSGTMSDDESTFILSHTQTSSEASDMSSSNEMQQLVEEEEKEDRRYGLLITAFNFTNSIIGSGIIGIPFALKKAGFGLGILVLIFIAVITDYSILLLVQGGQLSNTDSYQDVVQAAFGRPGFYVLTVIQFLYPFIAMVSYNVIIGDTITKIILSIEDLSVVHPVLGHRQVVITFVTVFGTLPLSLYRNIGKLGKWAFLSIVLIIFVIIAVIIRLTTFAKHIPPTGDAWDFADIGFFQAFGIISFSFMCHHNTLLVHSSLEDPTPERWSLMVHCAMVVSVLLCLVLGVLGYVSFTGLVQGDLLQNYCRDDVLMNCARFAFALTIMLTYPVECFVTREVVETAAFGYSEQLPCPRWRHFIITLVIVLLTAAVSMATDCLGIVLTLNGILLASPLAFIIPPCCVIRLRHEPLKSRANIGPVLLALFGLLVMVVGTINTLVDVAKVGISNCLHGAEPAYCSTNFTTNRSVEPSSGAGSMG